MPYMAIFGRILNGNFFSGYWNQFRHYLFSEGRLVQLITLKPIDLYKEETEIEIDTALVKLSIDSKLENIVQRRIDRTIHLLTSKLSDSIKDAYSYNFKLNIKAMATDEEISKFFNHHFAQQKIDIEENKYAIIIENIRWETTTSAITLRMNFNLEANRWFLRHSKKGVAVFTGNIQYHQPRFVIKTRKLDYTLETKSKTLKMIDYFYHQQILENVNQYFQYNFQEDLQNAQKEAEEQLNNSGNNWLKGTLESFELDNISIHQGKLHATFFAKGKLQLIR